MSAVYSTSGTAPLTFARHIAGGVTVTVEDGSTQVYMAADILKAIEDAMSE